MGGSSWSARSGSWDWVWSFVHYIGLGGHFQHISLAVDGMVRGKGSGAFCHWDDELYGTSLVAKGSRPRAEGVRFFCKAAGVWGTNTAELEELPCLTLVNTRCS